MKILFLNHNVEGHGTYWRCHHLARGLHKLGHTVHILTVRKKERNFLRRIPYVLGTRYDIVHAFAVSEFSTAIPALVSLLKFQKLFVDWDDDWKLGFIRDNLTLINRIRNFFEDNLPRIARATTVASKWLYDRATKVRGSNNVHYVPNCCNPDEFYYDPPYQTDKSVLGYMGYLDSGLDFLKELMEMYKGSYPRLYVIGVSERSTRNINYFGKCTKSVARRLLSVCKVLLFPADENSIIEKSRFPIRFNDYLCLNLPLIVSNVGEVARICTKYKCGIVLPRRFELWKDFIDMILSLPDKDRVADNSKAIEKLHYVTVAKKLEGIYNYYS